ncbi:MAG TPA: hypothetical protein VFA50_20845 [Stellaceae bacterium]|nr:hypothetical protein [Stellaceae bacterium]
MKPVILLALMLILGALAGTALAGTKTGNGISATTMSAYADYAREVSAECIRNRAYGLRTAGLPLKAYCAQLGNAAALKKHRENHPEQYR